MPTLKANHRAITGARPIDGKRTRYRIDGIEGLWLDVSKTGRRYWYVRYQPGGRQTRTERWYRLGDADSVGLADATKRARDVLTAAYAKDRDPHAERTARRAETMTFGDVYNDWYDRHAEPTLVRAATDQSIYRTHLQTGLGRQRLTALKRAEIGRLRDKVAKSSGPIASNNVLVLINRVLNWAVDEGLLEFNPAARLRKVGQVKPRERVLPEDEIPEFWAALAAMESMTREHVARGEKGRMLSPATRSVLRLMLLTGQRRSEVAGAEKSELELDAKDPVWMIPGERTKNGLLHRVPLCPRAKEEFARAVAASPRESRYVFPSPLPGTNEPILATTVTRAMSRLVSEIKISRVSPHDLRRTVGTGLARLGVPTHVRSLVLNHSPMSRGITDAVYNRYSYDSEKREALAQWENCLCSLVAAKHVRF
jgi:integrase